MALYICWTVLTLPMGVYAYVNYYLPDFVTTIVWGSSLVSHFGVSVLSHLMP